MTVRFTQPTLKAILQGAQVPYLIRRKGKVFLQSDELRIRERYGRLLVELYSNGQVVGEISASHIPNFQNGDTLNLNIASRVEVEISS